MQKKKQLELENELVAIYKQSVGASSPLEMQPHQKARIVIGFGEGLLQCKSTSGQCKPFLFESKMAYWLSENSSHILSTHDSDDVEVMVIEMRQSKEKTLWPSMPLD